METKSNVERSESSQSRNKDSNMTTKNEQSSKSDKEASGQKGVTQEQVGSGKEHDPNNFANNPERASAAGRKGGHQSHKND
jgi:general stress protein YciG